MATQRIVLIDADGATRETARKALSTSARPVAIHHTVDTALAEMAKYPPALIVTSIDMPDYPGVSAVMEIQRRWPHAPIVVLTDQGSEDLAVRCFREGAADYVIKDRVASELSGVVARLLEAPPAPLKSSPRPTQPVATNKVDASPLTTQAKQGPKSIPAATAALDGQYRVLSWNRARRQQEKIGEFLVRKWNLAAREDKPRELNGTRIHPDRLAVLHRQVSRLRRWSDLVEGAKRDVRRHARRLLANVVTLFPIDSRGKPVDERSFESFCKDISSSGCCLLHHELLMEDVFVIRFSYLGSPTIVLSSQRVRDRSLGQGMYEIGFRFVERLDCERI